MRTNDESTPISTAVAVPIINSTVPYMVCSSINDTNRGTVLFVREKLQGPLASIYDLEVTIPVSIWMSFQGIFSSIPTQTTTLRQYFLQKINDPQTHYLYISQIYNSLVSTGNPGRFFKSIDEHTTASMCNAAYRQFLVLLSAPAINCSTNENRLS